MSAPNARARLTDDRGRYRLFGLLPGAYLVTAAVDADMAGDGSAQTFG